MAAVHLFGLRLELDGPRIQRPAVPGVAVHGDHWDGTMAPPGRLELEAWLEVEGVHTLELGLSLTMVERTAGEWFPADGPQPQGGAARVRLWPQLFTALPDGPFLLLRSGCLDLGSISFPDDGILCSGGEILILIPEGGVIDGANLPVGLASIPSSRFTLDLGRRALTFRDGSFQARSACLLSVQTGPIIRTLRFFDRSFNSQSVEVSLAHPLSTIDLGFLPDDARLLPLHAEILDRGKGPSPDNPVLAPLTVSGHRLGLRLAERGSGMARLERVWLEPASGTASIHALSIGDVKNQHSVWTWSGPLDLHLRAGAHQRPATLLVAPIYAAGAGPALAQTATGPLHGVLEDSQVFPAGPCRLRCEHRQDNLQPVPAEVDPALVSELTAPWLEPHGAGQRYTRAKPAYAYRTAEGTGPQEAVPFNFQGDALGLPLVPARLFPGDAGGQTVLDHLHADLNGAFAHLSDAVKDLRHESGLHEGPAASQSELRIQRAFLPPAPEPQQLDLAPYSIIRDYGLAKVQQTIPAGASPDYLVLRAGQDILELQTGAPLDPTMKEFKLGGLPTGAILGVVKLSRGFSLAEIFNREPDLPKGFVDEVVDPAIRAEGWIGLFLLSVGLDYSGLPILTALLGEGLQLTYLALTPAKTKDGPVSVAGRVLWRNPTPSQPPQALDDQETTLRTNEVDIAWYDNRLTYFHADADLRFHRFFARPHGKEGTADESVLLKIIGSYDREKNAIRFLGRLAKRLALLPEGIDFGPVRQVYIQSAEIKNVESQTAIYIDGTIEPGPLILDGLEWFGRAAGTLIDFRGLQIRLPAAGQPDTRWLSILYPSLNIRFDGPHLSFGPLSLRLTSLGVDWNNVFDWGRLVDLKTAGDITKAFLLGLRLELMKLPELADIGFERLTFDFGVGLGLGSLGKWSDGNIRVSLNAFSLPKIHLDLMRFLRLEAEEAGIEPQDNGGTRVPWLRILGLSLSILDHQILKGMDLYVFSAQGKSGFFAYLPDAATLGVLKVEWFLVGQNIQIAQTVAERLVSIDAPQTTGEHDALRQDLRQAFESKSFAPRPGDSPRGEWLFAAGFDFFQGFVMGKLLFQDNAYYGIMLRGAFLKEWLGLDVAVSVLYVKGNRPAEDSFLLSIQVPGVTTGSFHFQGGVISLEIAMNGGFTLDVGFPWLAPQGGRRWDRAFGAIVTPWQGSGGFYLRKRNVGEAGGEFLQLAGGYALQFGLGASFGGGIFQVWVTVGIYAVLEGDAYLQGTQIKGLVLVGAVGLLVRGAGEINWWIISARVEVVISAEARTTLRWGVVTSDGRLLPAAAGDHPTLRLDFEVYASASAEACIGSGWFKVCAGISVSIPLRFSYTLTL